MQTELDVTPTVTPKPTPMVKHLLIDGLYFRIMQIPGALQIKAKSLPIQRIVILAKGTVVLENNGIRTKYVAPAHYVLEANRHYSVAILEDAVLYAASPTTETDINKLADIK